MNVMVCVLAAHAVLRGCSHFGRNVCRVDVRSRSYGDAGLRQQLLHPAVAHRIEQVHRSADVRAADPDLRNRGAPVRALSTARIRCPCRRCWNATESMSTLLKAMPRRANSLRTAQQNSHHSSANITTRAWSVDGSRRRTRLGARSSTAGDAARRRRGGRGGRRRRARHARRSDSPGVERDSASSASFMSTPMPSNSGVDR